MGSTKGGNRLLFVAFLFIGVGLGLAFGRPDVGAVLGLGLGFLSMSLVKVRSEPWEFHIPSSSRSAFLLLVGVAFIIGGMGSIVFKAQLEPYLGGFVLVLLGVAFLIFAGGAQRASR